MHSQPSGVLLYEAALTSLGCFHDTPLLIIKVANTSMSYNKGASQYNLREKSNQ